MTALGYSTADAAVPHGCLSSPIGSGAGLAVVALADTQFNNSRARLASQLTCLRTLDGFVPFSANHGPTLAQAEDWLNTHETKARSVLDDLRGHGQLTLIAAPKTTHGALPRNGAAWLQEKTRRAGSLRKRSEALLCCLIEHATNLGITRHVSQIHAKGARLDMLLPIAQATGLRTDFAHAVSSSQKVFPDWEITLTGPWPAFAFWTLEDVI